MLPTSHYRSLIAVVLSVCGGNLLCAAEQATPKESSTKSIDFAHDVLPLLKAHCVKCHTGSEPEGEFSMATRESTLAAKVAVPGKSGQSKLIRRVTSKDPDEQM